MVVCKQIYCPAHLLKSQYKLLIGDIIEMVVFKMVYIVQISVSSTNQISTVFEVETKSFDSV